MTPETFAAAMMSWLTMRTTLIHNRDNKDKRTVEPLKMQMIQIERNLLARGLLPPEAVTMPESLETTPASDHMTNHQPS